MQPDVAVVAGASRIPRTIEIDTPRSLDQLARPCEQYLVEQPGLPVRAAQPRHDGRVHPVGTQAGAEERQESRGLAGKSVDVEPTLDGSPCGERPVLGQQARSEERLLCL
jgi:hypothetical protein